MYTTYKTWQSRIRTEAYKLILFFSRIIPVFYNEMDKSDQLACIRYKNQNGLA